MDFVIDTVGNLEESSTEKEVNPIQTKSLVSQLLKNYKKSLESENDPKKSKATPNSDLDMFLKDMGWTGTLKTKVRSRLDDRKEGKTDVKEVLQKSIVLQPEFEKLHAVPAYDVSEKKLKEERRKEREKTKGSKWFGLPATELTDEVKRDLEIIQMRSVLDPKHFYKKNDLKVLPKYFQVGKVMDSPLDYYNNRLTKKERKKTLVEELLANAEFNKYNKRKFKEIIEEKQKTHYKAWRQAKKLKKRK